MRVIVVDPTQQIRRRAERRLSASGLHVVAVPSVATVNAALTDAGTADVLIAYLPNEPDRRACEQAPLAHGNKIILSPSENQACHAGLSMSPAAVSTEFISVREWLNRPRASSA